MAYQKVGGTPRFYIDTPSYLNSIGVEYGEGLDKDLFGLNPSNPVLIGNEMPMNIQINLPGSIANFFDTTKGYFGMLNHSISDDIYFAAQVELSDADNIINSDLPGGSNISPLLLRIYNKGFSIFSYNEPIDTYTDSLKFFNIYHLDSITFDRIPFYMGCITFGSYYDIPVSPDLDLSMEIEFDGVNNIKTLNGSTITQANYQGSPWWYDADGNKVEPWSVGESTGVSKRNGRRVWNLKFSYMSDKDLFASNYGSSTYMETSTGVDVEDVDTLNLGNELLTTTDLGSLTNGAMSAGTTEAGWTHHATYDYDSATRVDAGVTVVSDGTPDSDTDKFQSFHSNAFSVTKDAQYRVEYSVTINSGRMNYVVVIHNPVGSSVGYNSGSLSAGTHTISEIFTATTTDTDAYLEFYTNGNISVNATIHSASVRPINPSDFYYTIDNDDSFSSQVLNKISHGEKFIFQPDNTANNPSDFAICVLDGDSFDMKRVAPNVYDIEMKIREVW